MADAPTSAPSAVAPFSFLAGDHPLAPAVGRFSAAIRSHERHAEHAGALAAGRATVHTDLTLRPGPDGAPTLHRAYWSLQSTGPGGFGATTLTYHATRDRAAWLEFPDDPELPAMARLLDGPAEVLRYMPLRRCTYRARAGDGAPAIGKLKRPHRLADAWRLLVAVHDALGDGRAGFAVAAPAGSAPGDTFLQTALDGEDLAALVGPDRGLDLLAAAGALHRAMHAAAVPGVAPEDPDAQRAELRADATWVATALPERAPAVAALARALEARAPAPATDAAFCHGDLVPSQLLVAGERWAITDFDGARLGDPHRDLATWLAALSYDVPPLRAAIEDGDDAPVRRAEAAYLGGYGAHDERRLAWHRAAAEVHAVAVALKKDRHHPARAARALDVARAAAGCLA
jgi:hypothetical protein